ncbi:hypothetical protein SDRG_03766 [Saprolegnia diclina VS20]|uniref:Uncharacterized protein n=1 Tax=Saprolegnia diclina (strain VS20) TaxID=1156394 RepID=T0S1C9_SAPDV|nr:hypothetical protein SDRG_03766 [Saprolegnia diclina VS20]EQC38808.1 hypothetical protein SDRG_03766 [Saprolegnia diclina VS20]|eukprot:XP_008607632.1 hypothetical protein SDRG_03766 [Saprolegnia diclina VS20]
MASTKSRTGRKVLDTKTGKIVEEVKEDSIRLRVFDPENTSVATNPYRGITRANLRLKVVNRLFHCNAYYARDPFGMVLWPREWQLKMMPATPTESWCYDIVESDEPLPLDEAMDPRYEGYTVIKVANVPKECTEMDLRHWLLHGLLMDYDQINDAKFKLSVLAKKKDLLLDRLETVGTMEVSGKKAEQIDTRQQVTRAINSQQKTLDNQIQTTKDCIKRWTRLFLSEPITLSYLKDGTEHRFVDAAKENDKEKYHWFADFRSLRGQDLALMAINKRDWGDLRLAKTRPVPSVSCEEFDDPSLEVNMRMVRISRIKHGPGDYYVTDDLPTDDDFHFSSIDAMYRGTWVDGTKHDPKAIEYTNYGVYKGSYEYNVRRGYGVMVYGRGDEYAGDFDVPRSKYELRPKPEPYPKPVLPTQFQIGVPHGTGTIKFADGATYDGEMENGQVTGRGRYVSSAGVVEEGIFLEGLLHGPGYRKEPNGLCEEGVFEHGVLNGLGTQTNQYNDVYRGSFRDGAKCGRGVLEGHDGSTLTAFWYNDLPSGRGDLAYNQTLPSDPETHVRFLYEGSFSQGKVKGRHRHIDVDHATIGHIPFTTYGKSPVHLAYPMALGSALYKQQWRRHKNLRRRADREDTYKDDQERANLKLYYELLDDFYEAWADHIRALSHPDAPMTEEQLLRQRQERLRIGKPKKTLAHFPSYLQRVPLRFKDAITLGLLAHENAEEETRMRRRLVVASE